MLVEGRKAGREEEWKAGREEGGKKEGRKEIQSNSKNFSSPNHEPNMC